MSNQQPVPNTDVMSVKEIADYLRISESTIWKLIKEERIPYVNIGVRRFIFSKRRIDDWLYDISITPKPLINDGFIEEQATRILESARRSENVK